MSNKSEEAVECFLFLVMKYNLDMRELIAVATIPPLFLLSYVYRRDHTEKEPLGLLIKLFIFGALATIPIMIFELLVTYFSSYLDLSDNTAKALFDAFACAALVEETFKFLVTKLSVWNKKSFDSTFDGIIYSAFASLGFATAENILYCFEGGIITGLERALTSIPGHFCFGVIMGIFFTHAKNNQIHGKPFRFYFWLALIGAIGAHGFYDFCVMEGSDAWLNVFNIYIVAMYIFAFLTIKNSSKKDRQF